MNYEILVPEVRDDPLQRGYAAMSHQEVADDGNVVYCERLLGSMSGDELFCNTDLGEFAGLTVEQKQLWVSFCARDVIDPSQAANVAFVVWLFGEGSATVSALNAARREDVTRWAYLRLGDVTAGHVESARARITKGKAALLPKKQLCRQEQHRQRQTLADEEAN